MGHFVELGWPANPTAMGGRRNRAAFRYRAYVPDLIAHLDLAMPARVVETINQAEKAVAEFDRSPLRLGPLEVLARRLLRSESVASSRIEGLELSQRRLARAEVTGDESRDETARSVLANIAAMEKAIALAGKRGPFGPRDVCAIHRALMHNVASDAGVFRAEQNWIGGNSFNPNGADYVPPPPDAVPPLMADLCAFLERRDFPVLPLAAIAHAQFESIHPFADGNGRVGRALVHVVLRRRGLASVFVPPISLVLAGNAKAYIDGLIAYRAGDVLTWCQLFAAATATAVRKSGELAERFQTLQRRWLDQAGRPRADSAAAALIRNLPAHPILSVATAQEVTRRSKQAANEAMALLETAGVLKRTNIGKRNRAWEAKEIFNVLNDFERGAAMPPGTTESIHRAPYPGRGHSRTPR